MIQLKGTEIFFLKSNQYFFGRFSSTETIKCWMKFNVLIYIEVIGTFTQIFPTSSSLAVGT